MGRMERRQQKKEMQRSRPKQLMMIMFLGALLVALCGVIAFNILVFTSDVSKLQEPIPKPTVIYDQNGEIASEISASKIEGIRIDEVPETFIQAVVATEDQRFFKHNGLNYLGIARASIQNIMSGEIVAGGSTITQQLAKNVFLTQERTFSRKFKELILTKKIERTYTKNEILEKYLNQIYFGEGAWGVKRATQAYFGKDVKDLTLNEAAVLAGLIKAPSALSPYKHKEKATERRNLVLTVMKEQGYIDQSQLEEAKKQPITLSRGQKNQYEGKYPFYVDYIIEEAENKYDLTENEILSGGLRIYTELNPAIQQVTEAVYKDDTNFPTSQTDQLVQSGSVFLNPKTGGIYALVGGRGKHIFRQFNRATQLKRQPGSAFKPLAVYTPALEQGYDMFDLLEDRPININGYQPQNYDNQYRGQVTMYDAVVQSYNVPAVWLLQQMGLDKGVNAAWRFGIPLEQSDQSLSLALGGLNKGTSPLQMAQAFSTFPNNGTMMEAHAITRIEDPKGKIIAEWDNKSSQVTEPIVAEKMTLMLSGVVKEGTGRKAQVSGLDIAGKTGTTQVPFAGDGAKDHWFVGYTPEIVGAVWVGYDQTNRENYLTSSSGATAGTIFRLVLEKTKGEWTDKQFKFPLLQNMLLNLEKEDGKQKVKEKEKKRGQEKRGNRGKGNRKQEDRRKNDEDDD